VVSGSNRRIEENEAMLINLTYGTNIASEKDVIARFYSENRTSLTELIKTAPRRNLSEAFHDLVVSLDSIESAD